MPRPLIPAVFALLVTTLAAHFVQATESDDDPNALDADAASGPAVIEPDSQERVVPVPVASTIAAPRTTWYGWQTVIADGVGTTIMAGLAATLFHGNDDHLWPVVVAPYLLAGPVVHAVHGNPGRAAVSLLVHAALPVAAIYAIRAGKGPCGPDDDVCALGLDYLMGGILGMVAAAAIDAGFLAYANAPEPARQSNVASLAKPANLANFAPVLSVARSGAATIGVVGRF